MAADAPPYSFVDLTPDLGSFRGEVVAGLSQPRKVLSPKYFYDERGSALFEAICELPEYYPTRTELAIMQASGREIAQALGKGCVLIEYGCGSGRKTRLLIRDVHPVAYVAIDISEAQLKSAAAELAAAFPTVSVTAVCADYSKPFDPRAILKAETARRAIYFPGSTIGNFTPGEALEFLRHALTQAGPGGAMVVGVDLKKDRAVLDAAYNDAQGVTAEFNLNLLARINRELGANFDLAAFRHHAFYDAERGRIEMHLVSTCEQEVVLGDSCFHFRAGETIHTENSYKYSIDEFRDLARRAGFEPEACWRDAGERFAVHYLAVPH